MKVNVMRDLKGFDGEVLIDSNSKQPFKLKTIIVNALLGNFPGEENLIGEEKLKRYMLAEKVYKTEAEVELIAEEASLIKLLVGKMYVTVIVGAVYLMLENNWPVYILVWIFPYFSLYFK